MPDLTTDLIFMAAKYMKKADREDFIDYLQESTSPEYTRYILRCLVPDRPRQMRYTTD